ncbi:YIP1 family protein [Halobacteria archaeon AArc-dxtr1]|nr:YIP1 family protein [Halobacteria archaeon AArc-dxtr1]
MTSLSEVYEGNAREISSLRRLYAGTALVLVGAILAVVALLTATTEPVSGLFDDHFAAVRMAGVLAGIGVPAALVGLFIVLPASKRVKAAAAIGASLCLLGVALFWHAYPHHWRGYGDDLTLHVSAVYLLGLFTAIWCLFTAVVNFKTRNDPGGALEMNVTRQGRTKVVEVEDKSSLGGIGLLGAMPDGDVETQTNDGTPEPTSDGGSDAQELSSPLDEETRSPDAPSAQAATPGDGTGSAGGTQTAATAHDTAPESSATQDDAASRTRDRYCGSCQHFQYVRTSSGMVPYCGDTDEAMEDMDACEEWTPNVE